MKTYIDILAKDKSAEVRASLVENEALSEGDFSSQYLMIILNGC